MNYQDILRRANIQEISDYILFGANPNLYEPRQSPKERLEEAYSQLDQTLSENGIQDDSPVKEAINEFEYQLSSIYMELGFRAGMAFMMDLSPATSIKDPESDS